MRFGDLLQKAEDELRQEKENMATEEIKQRLREIEETEKTLGVMKTQLKTLLKKEIK